MIFIHLLQGILNRAKHANVGLTPFDSGISDHNMTWTHDKMHISETVDETRTKLSRNALGPSVIKTTEKFDLFKKLHELYNDLNRDESLQANYVSIKYFIL